MTIDLKELLDLQITLDNAIINNLPHINNKTISTLFKEKLLAFIVELCELANETKCFKYWSINNNLNRNNVWEEYVDGLHFLLSLGKKYKWKKTKFSLDNNQKNKNIVELFHEILYWSSKYLKENKEEVFFHLLEEYLRLAILLKINSKIIISNYKKKNQINHLRQKNNY